MQTVSPHHQALEGKAREARRVYIKRMLAMGFSFLELHLLNPDGTCSCRRYSNTRWVSHAKKQELRAQGIWLPPCKNPGKHPVRRATKSLMTDVDAIEAHLDRGGSVGLVLRVEGLPNIPIRSVVFDCDRPGAKEWLEARGITSPLMVQGKRGWHIYALLPDDCPDLRSDTQTLNPGSKHPTTDEKPGIDIKVSGHVVTPFSPNKTLLFHGRDLSEDPEAMAKVFQDMDSLAAVLPVIDPRVLVPTMKEFVPEVATVAATAVHVSKKRTVQTKRIKLSKTKPHKDSIQSPLKGLPYYHRKDMAIEHAKWAARGVGDAMARGTAMLRILYGLSKHYGLSEEDRFQVAKKHYNPRLRDEDGAWHPFRESELRRMVRRSSRSDVVNPFGLYGDAPAPDFDAQATLAKLQKKNLRSNPRRAKRRREEASFIRHEVQRFIYECCTTAPDNRLKVRQADLRAAYEAWTATQPLPAPATPKRFGMVLNALGFKEGWFGHTSDQYRLGIALSMSAAG